MEANVQQILVLQSLAVDTQTLFATITANAPPTLAVHPLAACLQTSLAMTTVLAP